MWQNYLAAAIHNLFRNRAYAAINILQSRSGLCGGNPDRFVRPR